jgi:hypothetical protein
MCIQRSEPSKQMRHGLTGHLRKVLSHQSVIEGLFPEWFRICASLTNTDVIGFYINYLITHDDITGQIETAAQPGFATHPVSSRGTAIIATVITKLWKYVCLTSRFTWQRLDYAWGACMKCPVTESI